MTNTACCVSFPWNHIFLFRIICTFQYVWFSQVTIYFCFCETREVMVNSNMSSCVAYLSYLPLTACMRPPYHLCVVIRQDFVCTLTTFNRWDYFMRYRHMNLCYDAHRHDNRCIIIMWTDVNIVITVVSC